MPQSVSEIWLSSGVVVSLTAVDAGGLQEESADLNRAGKPRAAPEGLHQNQLDSGCWVAPPLALHF